MISGKSTLAIFISFAGAAAFCGGACTSNAPTDEGGTSSSSSSSSGSTSSSTSGSTSSSSSSGGTDAGTGDGGPSDAGTAPDCFMNPTTYFEIINACTNAQQVDASAALPLLAPDGGLPPLP